MILLVLFLFSFFQSSLQGKPGVKMTYPEQTMKYMLPKLLDFGSQFIQKIHIPDQFVQGVSTPGGTANFNFTSMFFKQFGASNPTFNIIPGNEVEILSKDVSIGGDVAFGYTVAGSTKSGVANIKKITSDFNIQIGTKIDGKQPSNIQLLCSKFEIHLNDFDVDITGDVDEWVHDVVQTLFKSKLINIFLESISKELPQQIVKLGQNALNIIPFVTDVGYYDLKFSFLTQELVANQEKKYITLGTTGSFQKDGITLKGEPCDIPDLADDGMAQLFFSDYSLNSLPEILEQIPNLNYTLKDMFFLKTKYFENIIPNLYYRYPDKNMWLALKLDQFDPPKFTFSDGKIKLYFNINQIWEAILKVEGPMEAFTLSTKINYSVDFSIKNNRLKGSINLDDITTTIKKSFVGDFNVTDIEEIISSVFMGIVTPLINALFELGIELPTVDYVKLSDSKVVSHDGYFHVTTNFEFNPPKELTNEKPEIKKQIFWEEWDSISNNVLNNYRKKNVATEKKLYKGERL